MTLAGDGACRDYTAIRPGGNLFDPARELPGARSVQSFGPANRASMEVQHHDELSLRPGPAPGRGARSHRPRARSRACLVLDGDPGRGDATEPVRGARHELCPGPEEPRVLRPAAQ